MNITEKAKAIADSCRFCWMCRHICPIGNATGQERNTARARALMTSLVVRGAEKIEEIVDNIYECTLCGACTNNCVTGWDPKVFVQEVKTEALLSGVVPEYVGKLLETYAQTGNVYGAKICDCLKGYFEKKSDVLFFAGADATYKTPQSVKNACTLLEKAGVSFKMDENAVESGETLWFLTGKTAETQAAAKACAEVLNEYKTVIVYDPVDLKLFLHEYKEWGVELTADIVGFNEYILSLIEIGSLKVKKGNNEYSIQDNYAYARELDDTETGRKIVEKVGVVKDMLLIGKEANLAGQLVMNEYMPAVMEQVAKDRWTNAKNMNCKTVVTENPAEYVALKNTTPEGYRVISIEEMVLENL